MTISVAAGAAIQQARENQGSSGLPNSGGSGTTQGNESKPSAVKDGPSLNQDGTIHDAHRGMPSLSNKVKNGLVIMDGNGIINAGNREDRY